MTTAAGMQTQGVVERRRVKLLLVDDDRDNLLALQAVLDPLDEELILAESGTAALRLCLDHEFAAILLDVRMPGMDGFETAEMIRARRRSSQTPILFLTAYRSDEQLFRGYDLGAVDFLFKPIVPEVLQSKVAVFVELSRSSDLLRQQAAALTKTERMFRSMLEAAPDAMIITAEDGAITLANSRTDTLFGFDRERLIGHNIRMLVPQWSSEDAHVRLSGVRADSSPFPVEITLSPVETDDRKLVISAIRDITEHVKSEESIRRINSELERRVTERTGELTRSNEALRQFAWAASHDLQEPLRVVISFSQWLERMTGEKLSPEEKEILRTVESNAVRMERLLSALRQYIYMSEATDQPLRPIDCDEVLRSVLETLKSSLDTSQAVITSDPLPRVNSIEVLLLQLFQNLIGNALKYRSAERPPRIHISAERIEGEWLISVADNGIGIETQYLKYIFGVFKRLHAGDHAGTGIGLAICKAAAERLGGRIWAESEYGAGSTFKFTLPG